MCVLLLTVPSFGQSAATPKKPFTAAEEAKIREGVSAILTYIQTQQNIDSAAVARGGIKIPDVVDKALDKFGSATTVIYENVKKAAPQVWMIMMLQQYAKAVVGLLGPLLWLLMIFLFYRFISKHWTPAADEIWDKNWGTKRSGFWWRGFFTKILPIFAGFIACWVLAVQAKVSMLLFINPEYYAIRDLLILLLGSSHGM